ncbi:endosialin-like [Carassius auratus]|uniref:Endosialin-like n=1 Tax=Carassius auratus TaxID=7957 RepID=A0A6P6K3L3_CARAU|nr:endosialin-like [Carassius auratus]
MRGMGCSVLCVILLSSLLCLYGVQTQGLKERDALCSEDGCYVLYFQRKIFLDAWRSCKEHGGNLATIRHPKEAAMVKELFSNVELRPHHRDRANIWIGLQRQPRQCSQTRPLRGFSWITGDQDTQYTNWLQESSTSTCPSPRCVVIPYSTAAHEQVHNLKWKDGPCSISVDGYLCRYNFPGMCTAIASEGGGNTLYTTPFNLLSTLLTHMPNGSVATVPCPAKDDQSILCTQKEDGTVGWNREPPFCSDPPKTSRCDKDNGGCHHICIDDDSQYRCSCRDGYMLASDERSCVDVDECLQSPCEHTCVNVPGSFECHCWDGYGQNEEGACEDVDECLDNPCEHECKNTLGSHICHCHVGYAPLQENQNRCHDIVECQIEGTCEQMCISNAGFFECHCKDGYTLQLDQNSCKLIEEDMDTPSTTVSNPWITHNPLRESEDPEYPWIPPPVSDWSWLTELPNVETVPTDLIWTTEKEPERTTLTESSPEVINVDGDLNTELPAYNGFFPPAILTPVPDYYEDESTMVPTVLPSSTASGGAWSLPWFSSTQTKPETQETATNPIDLFGEHKSTEQDHYNTDMYVDKSTTFGPGQQTSTHSPMQSPGIDVSIDQNQGTSWLLVALLVPLFIFIVVMVVLGIIYCTRYTVKPQNKNTSDCYHWIAGAGDKAAADLSDSVTKTHV